MLTIKDGENLIGGKILEPYWKFDIHTLDNQNCECSATENIYSFMDTGDKWICEN